MDFTLVLPEWVEAHVAAGPGIFPDVETRMHFVINLARENVERGTGGPFGAGVFDADGRLIAPGVNLVESSNCSILHAEMVAIALAQQSLGRYDLSDSGAVEHELATSTEPCAMCFGAIPWSGVTRLACGARDEDARAIGFDEGPKLSNWDDALETRGIQVMRDILRSEAIAVLEHYRNEGGLIYNARGGGFMDDRR